MRNTGVHLLVLACMGGAVAAMAGLTVFQPTRGYWHVAANWSPNLPASVADHPIIYGGRVAMISNATAACGSVYVGQALLTPHSALEILPGATLDAQNLLLGRDEDNVGVLRQSGGAIIVRGGCEIGDNNGGGSVQKASGAYYLSAGALRMLGATPLRVGHRGRGYLQVSASGTLHTAAMEIGASAGATNSAVRQLGGSVVLNTLDIGGAATSNGSYTVAGGELIWSNTCVARGTLTLAGSTARVWSPSAASPALTLAGSATLRFAFGARGIAPLMLERGAVNLAAGTRLVVDGTHYTRNAGGPATFLLLQHAGWLGQATFTASNVTVSGFGPLAPALRYTTNALYLDLTSSGAVARATQGLTMTYWDMPINNDTTAPTGKKLLLPMSSLPNFTTTLVRTHATLGMRVASPALADCPRTTNMFVRFAGYLAVPSNGTYTLYVTCDDGAVLWLDQTILVNNNTVKAAPATASGSIALAAGMHALQVGYFNNTGAATLLVEWQGPGLARQPLPAEALYAAAEPALEGADRAFFDIMPDEERIYNYCPSFMFDSLEGLYKIWSGGDSNSSGDYILYKEAPTLEGLFDAATRVALAPSTDASKFDQVHACDPNVYCVSGVFYLTYSGNTDNSVLPEITRIGMAISHDRGRTFSRLHNGVHILGPTNFTRGSYGIGQSAVVHANDGYWYMIYTDSETSRPPAEVTILRVIRSRDPAFPTNAHEYVTSLAGDVGGVSVDMAYDRATSNFIVAANTSVYPDRTLMRLAHFDAQWRFLYAHEISGNNGASLGEGLGLLTDLDKAIRAYDLHGMPAYAFAGATTEAQENTLLWAPWVEGDTECVLVPQAQAVAALAAPVPVSLGANLTSNTISGTFLALSNEFSMDVWAKPDGTINLPDEATSGLPGTAAGNGYLVGPDFGGAWGAWSNHVGVGLAVGVNGVAVYEHTGAHLPATLVWPGFLHDWTHIAVVYSNKTPRLYVNGHCVRVGLRSSIAAVHPSAGQFGGHVYGAYAGRAWHYRVWNRILTPAQVAGLLDDAGAGALGAQRQCSVLDDGAVPEGSLIGTLVFTAALAGAQAEIPYRFFLPDDAGERLAIDPLRGTVAAFKGYKIDYEAQATLTIGVSAAVCGTNALAARNFTVPVANRDLAPALAPELLRYAFNGSIAVSNAAALDQTSNTFTMTCYARPTRAIALPAEANAGSNGATDGTAFVIAPQHGSAWGDGTQHAGAGLAVGTNGITVYERGTAYFPAPLVWRAPYLLTNWLQLCVAYANGTPTLYVNGMPVATGLRSARTVHPSSMWFGGAPDLGRFAGDLAECRRGATAWDQAAAQTACVAWSYAEFPNAGLALPAHVINSNTTTETVVCQLRAYPDAAAAPCFFSLINDYGGVFTIDTASGAIRLAQPSSVVPSTNYTLVAQVAASARTARIAVSITTSADVIPEPAALTLLPLVVLLLRSPLRLQPNTENRKPKTEE